MTILQATCLIVVALLGTLVVATRDPLRQAAVTGIFGLGLAALFLAVQAPDVALSQIAIGAIVVPVLVLLAMAKIRGARRVTRRARSVLAFAALGVLGAVLVVAVTGLDPSATTPARMATCLRGSCRASATPASSWPRRPSTIAASTRSARR